MIKSNRKLGNNLDYIGLYAFSGNNIKSLTIKGKSSFDEFGYIGENAFSWAEGYSDENIDWQS